MPWLSKMSEEGSSAEETGEGSFKFTKEDFQFTAKEKPHLTFQERSADDVVKLKHFYALPVFQC